MRLLNQITTMLGLPFLTVVAEPKQEPILFEDNFRLSKPGKNWQIKTGAFGICDGRLVGAEKPEDGHGAVTRTPVSFSDTIMEFSFRLDGAKGFNLVINDQKCKTVHAGHICRVEVTLRSFRLSDDKEGAIRNDIFAMRRDPKRKQEAEKLLVGRSKTVRCGLKQGAVV